MVRATCDALGQEPRGAIAVAGPEARLEQRVVEDVALGAAPAELDEPRTEGQLLVRALDPEEVWLSHEHEPWRPQG